MFCVSQMPLVVSGGPRWLGEMTWVSAEDSKNNCMVYSKGKRPPSSLFQHRTLRLLAKESDATMNQFYFIFHASALIL